MIETNEERNRRMHENGMNAELRDQFTLLIDSCLTAANTAKKILERIPQHQGPPGITGCSPELGQARIREEQRRAVPVPAPAPTIPTIPAPDVADAAVNLPPPLRRGMGNIITELAAESNAEEHDQ